MCMIKNKLMSIASRLPIAIRLSPESAQTLRFGASAPKIGAALEDQVSYKNLSRQAFLDEYVNGNHQLRRPTPVPYIVEAQ
jgi:hypothetical protein